jgi:hypothetical protein
MRFVVAAVLAAVLGSACGGGGGGSGPTAPPGLYEFASVRGDPLVPAVLNFGGAGTATVGILRNGAGDYTVTFTGTYPGVASIQDLVVFASVQDADTFDVASADTSTGTANTTTIVFDVFIWSNNPAPTLVDRDCTVTVLREPGGDAMKRASIAFVLAGLSFVGGAASCGGGGGGGSSGPAPLFEFASVRGDPLVPFVLHFGGNNTTNVGIVRVSPGIYDVTFTGSYPALASIDDMTVQVSIQDSDSFDTAQASTDVGGSVSTTSITVRVFVWSFPNAVVDRDFSILLMDGGGASDSIAAFAGVTSGLVPVVHRFAGSQTTLAGVSRAGVGDYTVTFTGVYPGLSSVDDIVVLGSVSDTNNFDVLLVNMDNAAAPTSTTISVTVLVWSTSLLTAVDRDFSVMVLR